MIREMIRRPVSGFVARSAILGVIFTGTPSLAAIKGWTPTATRSVAAPATPSGNASAPTAGVVEILNSNGQAIALIDLKLLGSAPATPQQPPPEVIEQARRQLAKVATSTDLKVASRVARASQWLEILDAKTASNGPV
jgi:hypothetical protein